MADAIKGRTSSGNLDSSPQSLPHGFRRNRTGTSRGSSRGVKEGVPGGGGGGVTEQEQAVDHPEE